MLLPECLPWHPLNKLMKSYRSSNGEKDENPLYYVGYGPRRCAMRQ